MLVHPGLQRRVCAKGAQEGLSRRQLLSFSTMIYIYFIPLKFCLVTRMVFPVVMCRCESWAIKKAECQRIDALKLWCWRRLLRVPWTARKSNQSILKEINPEYSLEGLMLKLKLQYFRHLVWRNDSLEKTLMLGKIEGRRRGDGGWDGWMASLTQWTWTRANCGR